MGFWCCELLFSCSRLHSNHLFCDCHLAWLSQWLRQRPTIGLFTQCSGPASLRGLNVAEVQKSEFSCSGGCLFLGLHLLSPPAWTDASSAPPLAYDECLQPLHVRHSFLPSVTSTLCPSPPDSVFPSLLTHLFWSVCFLSCLLLPPQPTPMPSAPSLSVPFCPSLCSLCSHSLLSPSLCHHSLSSPPSSPPSTLPPIALLQPH